MATEVVLQHVDGCPSWVAAEALLRQALAGLGESPDVVRQEITTMEDI